MALFGLGKKDDDREPEYLPSPLNTPMLNYRVYYMSRVEELVVRALIFAGGILVGFIFFAGLFKVDGEPTLLTYLSDAFFMVALGIAANKFFLPIYVESRLEKRSAALSHQFRDMLDALTSAFSAGSNITMAFSAARDDLQQQYEDSDYIIVELNDIIVAEQQGIAIADSLRSFADRSGDDDIESFADVFQVAARQGGSPTAIIRRVRGVLVDKAEITDEIRTKVTSNKTQLNAMTCMPLGIMLYMKYTNDTFATNLATPIGVACCVVALVIIFIAYRMGKRIVNVKV